MVDLALPRELGALGSRAIAEATKRRAGAVDAEHLLLAILNRPESPTATTLAASGLTYSTFGTALDTERTRSLRAAGIAPIAAETLEATRGSAKLAWGASMREVLRRADKPAAKDGRPGALERELAIAALEAELGTVPRALALAGIDRRALIAALSESATSGK